MRLNFNDIIDPELRRFRASHLLSNSNTPFQRLPQEEEAAEDLISLLGSSFRIQSSSPVASAREQVRQTPTPRNMDQAPTQGARASYEIARPIPVYPPQYQPAEQLTEVVGAIRDLAISIAQGQRRVKPRFAETFSGTDTEDPVDFLCELRTHFFDHQIVDDREQLRVISESLVGNAKQWFQPRKPFTRTYQEFAIAFQEKFNSFEIRTTLKSRLYGEAQKANEDVTEFLFRKRALFNRL